MSKKKKRKKKKNVEACSPFHYFQSSLFLSELWKMLIFYPVVLFTDIAAEKKENEFRNSIEGFTKDQLKHAETVVKNPLPTGDGKITFLCYHRK